MLKPQPQQASCSIVGAPSEHHPIGCSPTASHGSPRAYPREPNAHRLARTLHLTADLKLWAARLLAAAKANCLTHSGRAAKHARITAVFAIVPANACPPAPCCERNTHEHRFNCFRSALYGSLILLHESFYLLSLWSLS